jgi:tetratricopeptide (TPR) repeat protein
MSLTATFKQQMKHLDAKTLGSRCFVFVEVFTLLFATFAFGATPRDFRPHNDGEVIEVLAAKTKSQPTTEQEAVLQAKVALQSSRVLQDPRYLGRARSLLQPWWSKTDASEELQVLRATIEQSLHLFVDARKTLTNITQQYPKNLQTWLTLASLDRLAGNYASALASCKQVASVATSSTEKVYGELCIADIQCQLSNSSIPFRALLANMNRMRLNTQLLAWGYSLLAECEERADQPDKALDAYRFSLARDPDSYTAISYVDALLRRKQPEKAMQVLATLSKSDSVLLRLAHAMRMRNMPQWKMIQGDITQRFAESTLRGDDPKQHARERAYAALWLSDDLKEAVAQATVNIGFQKEAIDWLILFESIESARDDVAFKRYKSLLQSTGLRDSRLFALIGTK